VGRIAGEHEDVLRLQETGGRGGVAEARALAGRESTQRLDDRLQAPVTRGAEDDEAGSEVAAHLIDGTADRAVQFTILTALLSYGADRDAARPR